MLTKQEQHEIDKLIRHTGTRKAAIPEALMAVQAQRGWVSDEAVADIAAYLDVTRSDVDSIATFYNLIFRRPVGRHVILLCDSVSCWIVGLNPILRHLNERLGIAFGETTPDGRFTLLPTCCLGACDRAPAMMIGDELYGDLTPEKVDEILAKYA